MRKILAWLLASVVTTILSCAASSYSNLGSLRALGIDMGVDIYIQQIFTDLKGLGPLLFVFICMGLGIAFGAAGLMRRKIKVLRPIVYICAGMCAIFVMFWFMERVFFGTPIIQGARDAAGIFTQMVCGGIGGAIFAVMTRSKSALR